MYILYLTHDLADPATAKRVRMLLAGGARVHIAGFSRTVPPTEIAGCTVTDFGRTYNGRFLQRVVSVLKTVATLGKHRALFAGAELVLARNLEMLGVAVRGRAMSRHKPPIAYEVLDIHRLLLRGDALSIALRGLEGWLARRASLIITSSPAFIREYFEKRTSIHLPFLLIENKVFAAVDAPVLPRPDAPPWRIGWFGAIRCRKSLAILSEVARRHAGLVEVIIRGRPAYDQFEDFDASVEAAPHMRFAGAYRPEDLPSIYGEMHFSWAIDMFEEGQNSAWLLPNRIYEGGMYGAVPLTANGVETSRFTAERGIGHCLAEPLADSLSQFLTQLTSETYQAMANTVAEVPTHTWRCDAADCVAWVERLQQLTRPTTKVETQ